MGKITKGNMEKLENYIEQNSNCSLVSTRYVNSKSKMDFMCECGEVFKTTWESFRLSNKRQCNKCGFLRSSVNQAKTTKQFKREVACLVGDEYSVLEEYINAKTKIKMRHNECGTIYEVLPAKFTSTNRRCPYCTNSVLKTNSRFVSEVLNLVGKEYTFLEKYMNASTAIFVRHTTCGNKYRVKPHDFLNSGNRCPYCNESRGERKVSEYLKEKGIEFEAEFKFENCRNIRPLPFDFYIEFLNLAIEYDGELHYKPARFSSEESMKRKLKEQQRNDNIKNNYCKEKNIKLLRIPYWKFDNIEAILESVLP